MTIDTPAWVRDAVFYQVFPDRFARSARACSTSRVRTTNAQNTPATTAVASAARSRAGRGRDAAGGRGRGLSLAAGGATGGGMGERGEGRMPSGVSFNLGLPARA